MERSLFNRIFSQTVLTGVFFVVAASAHAADPALETQEQKWSYIMGLEMARGFKQQGVVLDSEAFRMAIDDVLSDRPLRLTPEEMEAAAAVRRQEMEKEQEVRRAEFDSLAKANHAAGETFRNEYETKKGVTKTDSGLLYLAKTTGKGAKPTAEDTVRVHYRGALIDGTEFDSSHSRGEPAEFPVGSVIMGWQEVIQLMPVGSTWEVVIPPEIGYGMRGAGEKIGPASTLVFDIELLDIVNKAENTDG